MDIAIIGAGFAGLATCLSLLERGQRVTVYDRLPLGGGTSGMAAGLLHPFTGVDARLARQGLESMRASKALLDAASDALGQPCYRRGVLRVAVSPRQESSFAACARKHPEYVHWLEDLPGLFIEDAYAVDAADYLQGLWTLCEERGAVFVQSEIRERPPCDRWVVAAGAQSAELPGCADLELNAVKGQLLELGWETQRPELDYALNAVGYLLMTTRGSCIAGSTYEHQFQSPEPDVETALPWIRERMLPFFPAFDQLPLIACRSGLRASTPDHQPICRRVAEDQWVLAGLGSKGLLNHARLAEEVAQRLVYG